MHPLFLLVLAAIAVQNLYAQKLGKVHTFEYYQPNFELYSSRYVSGNGLFVKYSGKGFGGGELSMLFINDQGKVLTQAYKDYEGLVLINDDNVFNVRMEKTGPCSGNTALKEAGWYFRYRQPLPLMS